MKHFSSQTIKGDPSRFLGDVYPTFLTADKEPEQLGIALIHFTPGAHTAWHSHSAGQYLYVTEGTALVQERGSEAVTLKPGEADFTAPGVEHWHGAAPGCFMAHLAVVPPSLGTDGPDTTWGEHVTDQEYTKATSV